MRLGAGNGSGANGPATSVNVSITHKDCQTLLTRGGVLRLGVDDGPLKKSTTNVPVTHQTANPPEAVHCDSAPVMIPATHRNQLLG